MPDGGLRRHRRVDATFRVEYTTIDELVVAYSSDLSKGGFFLCTDKFLPLNAVVRLQLDLPENGGEIPVICRVVYIRDRLFAKSTGKPVGMGLQFLDVDDECQRKIEKFIAERPTMLTQRPPQPRNSLKVLAIDDDRLSLQATIAPFLARGDVVQTATNGLDGLAACLRDPPDVILSDVQMPKMDGWQLVRMVRARPSLSSIPFIFCTDLSGEEERLKAYQLGVDDFVPKPARPTELLSRVDRMMARLKQADRPHVQQKTLRGDLEQVSLPSVLGFLELERKTGVLLLVGAFSARLFIAEGRPLQVVREPSQPGTSQRALLNELFGWKAGQFEFAAGDVTVEDELQVSLTALLLEHARVSDEGERDGSAPLSFDPFADD